jgi:hypothetical protein
MVLVVGIVYALKLRKVRLVSSSGIMRVLVFIQVQIMKGGADRHRNMEIIS